MASTDLLAFSLSLSLSFPHLSHVARCVHEIFTCSLILLCVANDNVGFRSANFVARKWRLCDFFFIFWHSVPLEYLLLLLMPRLFCFQLSSFISNEKIVRAALFRINNSNARHEWRNSQKCIETLAHFFFDGIVGTV